MLLSNPMTWKLSHMVVPGINSIMSPEYVMTSRTRKLSSLGGSSKTYYDDGGIGLGIVAALEKSGFGINPVCYSESGSNPVRYCRRLLQFSGEIDLSEEYTCVTTRDGVTKVYYNDDEVVLIDHVDRAHRDRRRKGSMQISEESPAKKRELLRGSPDFLTTCCLCKKKLQGKDIYMYKGDEGFCSKECRSVKIMEDNINVQHKSRNIEVLSSPCAGVENSPTGIFLIEKL